MRFQSFALLKYGRFDDEILNFSQTNGQGVDLHLIIGPNEAGKSTFRAAVSDFLFGIDAQTAYGFRFSYKELLLEAAVQDNDHAQILRRYKGNRNTLRDRDDKVLDPQVLSALLGGIDKTGFQRQYALDHLALIEGGNRLVQNRSDLSSLLFEAASGVAGLAARQRAMAEAAQGLWRRDNRSKTAYRTVNKTLQEAEKRKRAATTTAPAFARLQQALRHAEAQQQEARETLKRIEMERRALERLRRTAPTMQQLAAIAAKRCSLQQTVPRRLPQGTLTRLESYRQRQVSLNLTLAEQQKNLDGLQQGLNDAVPDTALLNAAPTIESLAKEAARLENYAVEIGQIRGEMAEQQRRALHLAQEIGWHEAAQNPENLQKHLPSILVREQLAALVADHAVQSQKMAGLKDAVQSCNDDLAAAEAALAALPEAKDGTALNDALTAAQRFDDGPAQWTGLQSRLAEAEQELAVAFTHLAPWSGTAAQLEQVQLPPPMRVEALREALGAHDAELRSYNEKLLQIAEQIFTLEADRAAIRESHTVVEAGDVAEARKLRDGLWQRLRDGSDPMGEAADRFERAIDHADRTADQHFADASRVSEIEQINRQLHNLQAQQQRWQQQLSAAEKARADTCRTWETLASEAGLQTVPLERIETWLRARDHTVLAARRVAAAKQAVTAYSERRHHLCADLYQALQAAGASVPEQPSPDQLSRFLDMAERLYTSLQETESRRRALQQRSQDIERRLRQAQNKEQQAAEQQEIWQREFQALLRQCQLSPALPVAAAKTALAQIHAIAEAVGVLMGPMAERSQTMQATLDAFSEAAEKARATFKLPGSIASAFEIAAHLSAALQEARENLSARKQLLARRDQATAAITAAQHDLAVQQEELTPLFQDAGLDPAVGLEPLREIAEKSAAWDQLDDDEARVMQQFYADADGLSVDELQSAHAALGADERAAQMAALNDQHQHAHQALEETTAATTAAKTALAAAAAGDGGHSQAADAEEARVQAVAEAAEIAGSYLDQMVLARLLRWAVDRYAAENQSPLLQQAERLFSELTHGRYTQLLTDVDQDPPVLLAKTDNGAAVHVAGLSDGTRDQLFLALRLAGVLQQTKHTQRLPFVADDLFVNFDDHRAAAGFRVLADVAQHTQVLYLSHHQHLRDIARSAVGEALNIVNLDS